jgi:UDP-GlcNAc:undecaprenyl-phosphate GlcNAc-1-phosphate transferase
MSIEPMLFCLILGCLISLLVIPLVLLPGLQRSLPWMRQPRSRQENPKLPVPRLGGLALVAAFVGVSLLTCLLYPAASAQDSRVSLGIIWTALAMFFIGFWDDIRPLGLRRKLLIQTLISIAACFQGVQIEAFGGQISGLFNHLGAWAGVFTVLWLLALTNLFLRINTINGLAGGIGLVLMVLLAYTGAWTGSDFSALCAIGMAGALLGFLVYNLPPARVTMGGGGAGLIGFLVANFSVVHPDRETTMAAILVLVLPLLGVGLALLPIAAKPTPATPANLKSAPRPFNEDNTSRQRF